MTWKAIQLWRKPELADWFMQTFAFLPFGDDVRRGEVRSMALTSTSLWGAALLIWLALLDTDASAPSILFVTALAILLLPLICEVSVVLFNKPKWVVPPHMRADLGVIAARRAHRKPGKRRPARRRQ
jgi:hypothetical protein